MASASVAIVGGGVAGLSAARRLREAGLDVIVFDKGRRPAGRISTRREPRFAFDHGAQYFTARDAGFRALVAELAEEGVVAPWRARLVALAAPGAQPDDVDTTEPRFVGVPGMSALAGRLARDLDAREAVRIESLEGERGGWTLVEADGSQHAGFASVVLALPAPQAADLLPRESPLHARVERVEMSPCLAVMLGLPERYEVDWDGAFVEGSPLAWVARDSSKPGRPDGEAWVLHATTSWSREHFDDAPAAIAEAATDALHSATGVELPEPELVRTFRWRWARSESPGFEEGFLHDAARGLAVCGDWCVRERVEGAWVSGLRAAEALLAE